MADAGAADAGAAAPKPDAEEKTENSQQIDGDAQPAGTNGSFSELDSATATVATDSFVQPDGESALSPPAPTLPAAAAATSGNDNVCEERVESDTGTEAVPVPTADASGSHARSPSKQTYTSMTSMSNTVP